MKRLISVVLPCHNEAKSLPLLTKEISEKITPRFDYEIICVDDGSDDNTAEVIEGIGFKNNKIKGLILSRNFGHQAALLTGIRAARGEAILTMDADFQHPPAVITEMLSYWKKGFDLVQAKKIEDKTASLGMKLLRKWGYRCWKYTSGGMVESGVSDFCLMDKLVVSYLKKTRERVLVLRGVVRLAARKIKILPYRVPRRRFGSSSYNLRVFINMFFSTTMSFGVIPLRLGSMMGLILMFASGVYLVTGVVIALVTGRRIVEGWQSSMLITWMINGFIIVYLGIVGEYIGIIFKEVKRRPVSIVKRKINFN